MPKSDPEAKLNKPGLMKVIVQELSGLEKSNGDYKESNREWTTFSTSSPEAYVTGTIVFDVDSDHFTVPFDTSFLFTCLKSMQIYKVAWSVSLS